MQVTRCVFCLSVPHSFSFNISFLLGLSPFSHHWYTLPFHVFLSSFWYRPLLCRVRVQGLEDITFLPHRGSNTRCQFCCCSGLGSHLYAWPPCSTYRVSVLSNLQCNKFCLTSRLFKGRSLIRITNRLMGSKMLAFVQVMKLLVIQVR